MVEPVKYKPENVVEVKPGDVIPGGLLMWFKDKSVRVYPYDCPAGEDITHYAPAPILDLPPEPQEVEFGEAMERIKDGDRIGWKRGADLGQVVYLRGGNLMVSRPLMPDTYVTDFGVLVEGTFYEIPETTEPEPKTTGLTYEEALLSGKPIRHTKMGEIERLCWDGDGTLVWTGGNAFIVRKKWLTPEWEIVE